MVFGHSVGSKESTFCTSTLPNHYTSVAVSNSTALVQAAPPPLPPGEKGFIPSFVPGTKVGATGPAGFPTLRTLAVNAELRRAQKRDKNLGIFDWNRVAADRPSWFSGDKVHLSRGGTTNLARHLGKFLKRVLAKTESTTTPE